MSDKPAEKPAAPQIQIQIDDAIANGTYANLTLVNHSETEFVLDFVFLQPMDTRARVRARIVSSPKHAKRLVMALQDNLQRYEARFGTIDAGPGGQVH